MQNYQKRRLLSTPLFILLVFGFIVFLIFTIKKYAPSVYCPIKEVTGLKCPGCGGTAAIRSLLEFNFSNAFHSHQLFTIGALGLAGLSLLSIIIKFTTGKTLYIKYTLTTGIITVITIVLFTVLRNVI